MKRSKFGVLALLMALLPATASAKVNVITSITPLRSLVESVGGDLVHVESIGRGDEDPHFVEVRPSFIMKIAKAKLYVSIGMSLDFWAKPLIENARNPDLVFVNASTGIHVLGLPTERVSPKLGDVHPQGNPHFWMDPYNIPVAVKNILSGLVKVDPAHADAYKKNAEAFLAALKSKTQGWLKAMAPYKGTKVITYHESWEYFADRFGLQLVGEEEPKPGIPPSGSHTQAIIQIVKSQKVPLIVQENYYSTSTSQMIAANTGAKVVVIPQLCDGAPGTSSYIDLIDYDVNHIVDALKK
jgi:ABC-type Zn uptake system ZnuABC Zn-binding protein ZnuA